MTRILTPLLVAAPFLACRAHQEAGPDAAPGEPAWAAEVDRAVEAALEEHGLPGGGVVVAVDGRVVFQRGYGFADLEAGTPVDPDSTLVRIGSISKALTLLTLSRLVDDGRIALDADVSEYIEGIANPLGFEDPVTVEHLLTHTSGFDQIGGSDRQVREFGLPLAERKALRVGLGDYLRNGHLRRVSPAGLHYRYDTYGTTLAGYLIESITGHPYPEAMRREMFAPLGMETAHVEAPGDLWPRLARGYEEEGGELVAQPYEVYVTTPASSIDASLADMGRLLEALTGGGANATGRLFSTEMAAAVHAPQFRPHPEFSGTTHGLHESVDASGEFAVPVRTVDHGGTMLGYRTLLAVLPRWNVGVFAFTNRSDLSGNPVAAAAMRTLVASLPDPPRREPLEVPDRQPEASFAEYAGDYFYGVFNHAPTREEVLDNAWQRGDPTVVAERDGALFVGEEEYRPGGNDLFVRADGTRRVFFGRDAGGAIRYFSYDSSPDAFERERPDLPYVEIGSLAQAVYEVALEEGIDAALDRFDAGLEDQGLYLREAEMNNVGYALLGAERADDAVRIFRRIAEHWPDSWNAHDSLGEALALTGATEEAIASYRRSLELNPSSAGGAEALERLSGAR